MLSGTIRSLPRWCQPAPSQITTAIELCVTCVLISFRCSFMPSVLAAGMIMAAPTPAPGRWRRRCRPNHAGYRAPSAAASRPAPRCRRGFPSDRLWPRPGTRFRSASPRWFREARFHQAGEVFLKAASASGSFFGCTGRGCNRVRPSLCSHLPMVLSCTSTLKRRLTSPSRSTAAPTHHMIDRRVGPLDDEFIQFGHLRLGQDRRRGPGQAGFEAFDTLIVVAMHPIAQRLPVHPVGRSRDAAGMAVQHHRQREKAAHLCAVAALAGECPQRGARGPSG